MVGAELGIPKEHTCAWSDSTIVLSWLASNTTRLKVYVAHHVAEIVGILEADRLRHVPTDENPADLVSRGVFPEELAEAAIWWKGPPWLSKSPSTWPKCRKMLGSKELPELKSTVLSVQTPAAEYGEDVSDYNRLVRCTAWILRFVHNCKKRAKWKQPTLTHQETEAAKRWLVQRCQQHYFSKDLDRVEKKLELTKSSPLAAYRPFMEDGLLRVGGHLQRTGMQYANKAFPGQHICLDC